MTFDIWAGPTPYLDGQASASHNAAQGTVSLTTTQSNDLIYVAVSTAENSDVTVSGAGLKWNLRGSVDAPDGGKLWMFWAVAYHKLNSASITAKLSVSQEFALVAFAVSGANTSTPFDSNLDSPQTAADTSGSASLSLKVASKNSFLIGVLSASNTNTVTPDSQYTTIETSATSHLALTATCKEAAATGTHTISYMLPSSTPWSLLADAIVPQDVSEGIAVSGYTTMDLGKQTSTLFRSQHTNPLLATGSQVATTFPVAQSSIPANGYIQIVLTAPANCGINIEWGNTNPTNMQFQLSG
jgi:hypothetical protein